MLAIVMIIGGILLRLVPHPANFAPITALGLFGGCKVNKKFAVFVPLLAMIISDYLLLYISPFEMKADFERIYPVISLFHSTTFYVWGSFIISSLIGIWLRKHGNIVSITAGAVVASSQFFLITNFGVWASGMYERGIDGLLQSYIMGLPFFKWTMLGDLFYAGVFFGAYELALRVAKSRKNVLSLKQSVCTSYLCANPLHR